MPTFPKTAHSNYPFNITLLSHLQGDKRVSSIEPGWQYRLSDMNPGQGPMIYEQPFTDIAGLSSWGGKKKFPVRKPKTLKRKCRSGGPQAPCTLNDTEYKTYGITDKFKPKFYTYLKFSSQMQRMHYLDQTLNATWTS